MEPRPEMQRFLVLLVFSWMMNFFVFEPLLLALHLVVGEPTLGDTWMHSESAVCVLSKRTLMAYREQTNWWHPRTLWISYGSSSWSRSDLYHGFAVLNSDRDSKELPDICKAFSIACVEWSDWLEMQGLKALDLMPLQEQFERVWPRLVAKAYAYLRREEMRHHQLCHLCSRSRRIGWTMLHVTHARLMCKSLEGLDIFSADDVGNWNYLESIKVCHMTRTYW